MVLSREEVQRLLTHAANQKHRTMLMTAYAAGLRLSEVLHLQVPHIDSARMTIRVVQGKGGQDRDTLLSARLLEALRAYWKVTRPTHASARGGPAAGARRDRGVPHRSPGRASGDV